MAASTRPLSPSPLSSMSLSTSMREATAGKTQRWLDVEARVLSNHQEFVKHRQDTQLQLREIQDSLQRAVSNEPKWRQRDARFEAEVERVNYKLQQLSKVQDELVSRLNDHSAMGSASDAAHARSMEKLEELTSVVDAQKRSISMMEEGVLREASETARFSRKIAEEVLGKMEELNTKLGENMSNLEEQSAWSLKRVQQDVKDLANRVDGGTYTAEAELRKLEARLEATWRARVGELQSQTHEASERAARADRDAGGLASQISKLGSRLQDCMTQIETLDAMLKQCGQRIDGSSARMEEVHASLLEQIGRSREDMSTLVHEQQRALKKALDEHLEDSQEHSQRLKLEVSGCVDDACARVETLREVIRGQGGELASLRSVLGNAEQRVEDLASSLSTTRDGAQEELAQLQHAMREELGAQIKQTSAHIEDQVDIRTRELRVQVDALRLELSESNDKHQSNTGEHAEHLARLQERTQDTASGHQKTAEQVSRLEQTLRQVKESSEQRVRTMQLNVTEQIHQTRDEVQRLCRDRVDECSQSGQQLHELQEQQLRDLRTDVHRRLDAVEIAASEQTAAVGEHSRRLYEQACQQSRAWIDDAVAQSSTLVGELGDRLAAQLKDHGQQADTHRKALENLEAQHRESSLQFRSNVEDLQGQHNSWHSAEKERSARVAKLGIDLQEARQEAKAELDLAQKTAQRQLNEQDARWEKRLESSMAGVSSSCLKSVAECRSAALDAAREAAERVEVATTAQMHSHCQSCMDDLKNDIAAMRSEVKEAEGHHVSRLATLNHEHALARRDVDDRFRQHSDSFKEQLANVRFGFEEQLHQQHGAFSQQLLDVGEETADKLRHVSGTHSNLLEEVQRDLTEKMRKMASSAEEHGNTASQKVGDRLSKLLDSLSQDVSELQGQSRSLGERLTSHRDQHVETQQQIEERLLQHIRVLEQGVSEAKVMSASHDDRLVKHQHQTADSQQKLEERLTKLLKEAQVAADNANERCRELHARADEQQRFVSSMHEQAEEQTSKRLREHAQNIEDLRVAARGLTEGLASHQVRTMDEHQQGEVRLQQLMRDIQKDVADLQGRARDFAEQLQSHKSQQAGEIGKLVETLSEKANRQSEKSLQQLAEVRESLTESVRQVRTSSSEHLARLQQASDAANAQLALLKDKSDEQQCETKLALKELAEASQATAEKQLQEYRQQLSVRSADADTRIAALRQELEQRTRQQDEEMAIATTRLHGLERRQSQDKESGNALVEAHSQQAERKIEAHSERIMATMSEQMRALVSSSEERATSASQLLDERLSKLVHTLDERVSSKAQALGQDLVDLQGASRSLSERLASHRDQHAEALQKAEERLVQQLRSVGQEVSDLKGVSKSHGDKLTKHQDQTTDVQQKIDERITKLHHSLGQDVRELQSACHNVNERCDGLHGTLETQQRLLAGVHEQTEEHIGKRLRDHAQHIEDLQVTSRGLTESLGGHKAQSQESQQKLEGRFQQTLRDVQKDVAELQVALRGVGEQLHCQQTQHTGMVNKLQDNLTEKLARQSDKGMEQLTEVRDSLAEAARLAREDSSEKIGRLQHASDACNEQLSRLRERAEEQQRENKKAVQVLELSLTEASQLAKKQLQESRQQFTARSNEGDARLAALRQDMEQKVKQQSDELSATVARAVEEVRRSAASAVKDLGESAERRFREHGEASTNSAAEICAQQAKMETELRNLVHSKSQGHEIALSQVSEQVMAHEKDLKEVKDELPLVNRRHEATRQAHNNALDEHKRSVQERHTQLSRRVQGESENLARLAQQVAAAQDEWKLRHREQAEHTQAAVTGVQDLAQQDSADLRAQLGSLQADLQGVHGELGSALRATRDKHGAAITDISRRHEEHVQSSQRKFEEVDNLTSQTRLLAILTQHVEGLVRAMAGRELQAFQREALDSLEWKLERCVQWLHGANVKLGLNPHGTMFSTDRFRAMLFDEGYKQELPKAPVIVETTPRSKRRSNSANGLRIPRGGVHTSP